MRFIFDLDGTVIDSSHRQNTKPDGSLDLDRWREMSTRKMIFKDSLLPLASAWHSIDREKNSIVVCTARVLSRDDLDFLQSHRLFADAVLSRPYKDCSSDGVLKHRLLSAYCAELGLKWRQFCNFSLMYDDNLNVINHLKPLGLRVIDATIQNMHLQTSTAKRLSK